jgi:hypothetical protein
MCRCRIQWIDNQGKATPDNNHAIGSCRTIERDEIIGHRKVHFEASEWFPICSEHARRLDKPGMQIWEFWPIYNV